MGDSSAVVLGGAAIAIAAQAGHFVEELAAGFHERLPAAFA